MAFQYLTSLPLEEARTRFLDALREHGFGAPSETVPVVVPEHSAKIKYLNGPGGAPVGFLLDGALYEYVRDALGDVVALVKASDRSLAAVYAYSAYGETAVLLPDGAVDDDELSPGNLNPFRYRGQRQLLCGLYLMGARAYDPAFARFLSPDGEGYLDPCAQFGLNAYAYCYGDPMTYSDPSGHMPEWVQWVVGGVLIIGADGRPARERRRQLRRRRGRADIGLRLELRGLGQGRADGASHERFHDARLRFARRGRGGAGRRLRRRIIRGSDVRLFKPRRQRGLL